MPIIYQIKYEKAINNLLINDENALFNKNPNRHHRNDQ